MSDLLIRDFSTPSNCMECEWRDAEACGACELMIDNPFLTFGEQFSHCPFQVIAKRHVLVPVPPHGRLIDADALMRFKGDCYDADGHLLYAVGTGNILRAPTIIPAEEAET